MCLPLSMGAEVPSVFVNGVYTHRCVTEVGGQWAEDQCGGDVEG